MSRLTILTKDKAQVTMESMYQDLERRIVASPPGLCPVDLTRSFIKMCLAQSCGKCVPCRVGLRQLARLKEEIIGDGFDMVIMRELTGGLYFGKRHTEEVDGLMTAVDTLTYNEEEIRRIAIKGFEIAMKRRKKVTSVDKANVLDSSRLWRKIVHEVAKDYPEVELEDMLVDNCAMQLVMNPGQFDVILTENMFGDILSDEASMITGSIGMLSSASLGKTKLGLYEPSHGSAPDIAGKNIANPIATILSAAMMLRYSLDLDKEADAIEAAVAAVLKEGYRTTDIYSEGCTKVGTDEMGDLIAKRV